MERLRFGIVGVNDINPTAAAARSAGSRRAGSARRRPPRHRRVPGHQAGRARHLKVPTARAPTPRRTAAADEPPPPGPAPRAPTAAVTDRGLREPKQVDQLDVVVIDVQSSTWSSERRGIGGWHRFRGSRRRCRGPGRWPCHRRPACPRLRLCRRPWLRSPHPVRTASSARTSANLCRRLTTSMSPRPGTRPGRTMMVEGDDDLRIKSPFATVRSALSSIFALTVPELRLSLPAHVDRSAGSDSPRPSRRTRPHLVGRRR